MGDFIMSALAPRVRIPNIDELMHEFLTSTGKRLPRARLAEMSSQLIKNVAYVRGQREHAERREKSARETGWSKVMNAVEEHKMWKTRYRARDQ